MVNGSLLFLIKEGKLADKFRKYSDFKAEISFKVEGDINHYRERKTSRQLNLSRKRKGEKCIWAASREEFQRNYKHKLNFSIKEKHKKSKSDTKQFKPQNPFVLKHSHTFVEIGWVRFFVFSA